jgi:putative two-component system response regulator
MSPSPTPGATILVADNDLATVTALQALLQDDYRLRVAASGRRALQLALTVPPDLILLDIGMPDMDGYEVCRRLKDDKATSQVPVIFLSTEPAAEAEERGFAAGAADFIYKPVSMAIAAARVRTQLQVTAWQHAVADRNLWLQQQIAQRLSEINHVQDAAIYLMLSMAEFRGECNGNHLRRTQEYVRLLALELARRPQHRERLTHNYIELMARSVPLHDIGKIAIPDHILLKPGKLSATECEIMKTHAQLGHDLLARAGKQIGEHGRFLLIAQEIAQGHHERWDGSGYPNRRAGAAIPLAARLMAVADVFDAMISQRPYKDAVSGARAAASIAAASGAHFDPEVVETFLTLLPEFEQVALRWAD